MSTFTIEVGSSYSRVVEILPSNVVRQINKVTSYDNPNVWRPTFWNRKIYLFKSADQTFPSGLLKRVKRAIKNLDYKVIIKDNRDKPLIDENDLVNKINELNFCLRDYQTEGIIKGVQNPYGLFWLPTGSGKTVLISTLLMSLNLTSFVLTHRKELLYQLSESISSLIGEEVGMIGAGYWNPKKWTVGLVNSFIERNNIIKTERVYSFLKKIEYLVVDECFIAGTKVNTPYGYKNIEDIIVGDIVCSYDVIKKEFVNKKVLRLFKKSAKELVRIEFGKTCLVCTTNHEFFAMNGWKKSLDLSYEDSLLHYINGWKKVEKTEYIRANKQVYNIEVEDIHTYLVEDCVVKNCHHLGASSWWKIAKQCVNTKARHGFSGTCFRTDKSDLLLLAHTGDVISKHTTSEMIENGWLSRPKIYMPSVRNRKEIFGDVWFDVEKEHIINFKDRNIMGCEFIFDRYKKDEQILVMVSRLKHGEIIKEMLIKDFGIDGRDIRYMTGEREDFVRKEALSDFREGRYPILIGTSIYNEGVDLPTINAAINMAGGDSDIATTQRLGRALRKIRKDGEIDVDPDEEQTIYYMDFFDEGHKFVRKHSRSRLEVYKNEPAFVMVDDYDS